MCPPLGLRSYRHSYSSIGDATESPACPSSVPFCFSFQRVPLSWFRCLLFPCMFLCLYYIACIYKHWVVLLYVVVSFRKWRSFVSFCTLPFLPRRSVSGIFPRWFIHLFHWLKLLHALTLCECTTIYNSSLLLMGTWVSNVSHCKRCHSDSSPARLQHTCTWLWAVCLAGWGSVCIFPFSTFCQISIARGPATSCSHQKFVQVPLVSHQPSGRSNL